MYYAGIVSESKEIGQDTANNIFKLIQLSKKVEIIQSNVSQIIYISVSFTCFKQVY